MAKLFLNIFYALLLFIAGFFCSELFKSQAIKAELPLKPDSYLVPVEPKVSFSDIDHVPEKVDITPFVNLGWEIYESAQSFFDNLLLASGQPSQTLLISSDAGMASSDQEFETSVDLQVNQKKRLLQGHIYETVQRIDQNQVETFIKANTKFNLTDFDPRFSLSEIAQALYDIANEEYRGDWVSPIYFGNSVDSKNRVVDGQNIFSPGQGKIYASFEIPGGGVDQVLVKWYHYGEEQPFVFTKTKINPELEFNYSWASHKDNNWPLGEYLVEVYDVKNQFLPISGGRFHIEQPPEEDLGNQN